jgi:hypothetical protein
MSHISLLNFVLKKIGACYRNNCPSEPLNIPYEKKLPGASCFAF